jgi:flagellar biosynthetic protein FlhB
MSGERTEAPTPKRLQDARKRGQVLRSAEVNTAIGLLAGAWLLQRALPEIGGAMLDLTHQTLELSLVEEVTPLVVRKAALEVSLLFARLTLPLMLGLCAIGVLGNVAQAGFFYSAEAAKPKFSRVNPVANVQRLISGRAMVETLKTLVKLVVVGYFAWSGLQEHSDQLALLSAMALPAAAATLTSVALAVMWKVVGAFVVLALADYAYQRWQFKRSLMMTREEIKQEMKESEGNPELKARLRQRARALAQRRMMQDVPEADVIVTNPTHFAVAIKYEAGMDAPTVLAKGQDFIAQQIKKLAGQHSVPIVENKPLAQALFKACDVGQSVPPDLFKAVAEVLAYVYRLRPLRAPNTQSAVRSPQPLA